MAKHTYTYIVSNDDDGKPHDPTVITAIFNRIATEFKGKKCKVVVGPTDRTLLQNSTIHYVIQEITDQMAEAGVGHPETGEPYSFDTWREYFFEKHCPRKEIPVPAGNGVMVKSVRMSTAELNTVEFNTVLNKIIHDPVLIKRGIYIEIKSEK